MNERAVYLLKIKKNEKKIIKQAAYTNIHTHTHTYIDYYDEEEEKKIFKQYIK
jgi:hypothetical protein